MVNLYPHLHPQEKKEKQPAITPDAKNPVEIQNPLTMPRRPLACGGAHSAM